MDKAFFIVMAILFGIMAITSIIHRDGFSAFVWVVLTWSMIKLMVSLQNKRKEVE